MCNMAKRKAEYKEGPEASENFEAGANGHFLRAQEESGQAAHEDCCPQK